MAKSNKYTVKVPKLEDYKPDWVSADGEVDVEKVTKIVHTLMQDKAKAQDAREDALADVTEAQSKVTELQTQVDAKSDPDTKAELDKARAAQVKAEGERDTANLRADRVEVGAEKGLTPTQAKRLVGTNREELEADADELVKDLGITPGKTDDEHDEGDETGRTAPLVGLKTGGDPKPGQSTQGVVDYEAAAAQIQGNRPF